MSIAYGKVLKLQNTDTVGLDKYNLLVETWEAIVAENTAQLHLVSLQDKSTWEAFSSNFTKTLITFGKRSLQDGFWDEGRLASLSDVLTSAKHRTAEELEREMKKPVNLVAENESKVKGLIGRLRDLL